MGFQDFNFSLSLSPLFWFLLAGGAFVLFVLVIRPFSGPWE